MSFWERDFREGEKKLINLMFVFAAQPTIDHVDIMEMHSYESVPLKYEVIAHGIPKPEAIWYHDGKEVKPDANTAIVVEGVSGTLRFFLFMDETFSVHCDLDFFCRKKITSKHGGLIISIEKKSH